MIETFTPQMYDTIPLHSWSYDIGLAVSQNHSTASVFKPYSKKSSDYSLNYLVMFRTLTSAGTRKYPSSAAMPNPIITVFTIYPDQPNPLAKALPSQTVPSKPPGSSNENGPKKSPPPKLINIGTTECHHQTTLRNIIKLPQLL